MAIIGTTFSSLEATKNKVPVEGEIKVNSTPRVLNIREVDIDAVGKKALSMEFSFGSAYEPGLANITLKGELLYVGDKQAEVLKQWKSKKALPSEVSVEVLNHLFRRCLLKIAVLAEDLQLPPPLELPRVQSARPQAEAEAK